jgi:hypothetical protein
MSHQSYEAPSHPLKSHVKLREKLNNPLPNRSSETLQNSDRTLAVLLKLEV